VKGGNLRQLLVAQRSVALNRQKPHVPHKNIVDGHGSPVHSENTINGVTGGVWRMAG